VSKAWRDITLVMRHELTDALRSRWALALAILFLVALVLGFNASLNLLHRVETQLAEAMQIEAGGAGMVTESLWKSPRFRRFIEDAVDDKDIARGLFNTPPTALIYSFITAALLPLLVMLTTSTRIADEVSTGSIRYAVFRTSRPAWVLGKFLGQALMIGAALGLSLVCAWVLAVVRVKGLAAGPAFAFMAVFAAKAWVFALTFIGLALGVSQLCRSPHLAVMLGLVIWTALNVLSFVADRYAGPGWRSLWTAANLLTPGAHDGDLWRQDAPHVLANLLFLFSLAGLYLGAGYLRLSRKDL